MGVVRAKMFPRRLRAELNGVEATPNYHALRATLNGVEATPNYHALRATLNGVEATPSDKVYLRPNQPAARYQR